MMICPRAVAILCLASATLCALAQQQEGETPSTEWSVKFETYKVQQIYQGKPAPAQILTTTQKMFRTRIREGAKKGPNFAGHYTVIAWGCGAGCVNLEVVDAISGKAYDASPFSYLAIPFAGSESGHDYQGLVYHRDSRLLIADGCPEDKKCGTYYYEWRKKSFRLVKFEQQETSKE
jgi:hypothetical protein